jgi:hypothetical protein
MQKGLAADDADEETRTILREIRVDPRSSVA